MAGCDDTHIAALLSKSTIQKIKTSTYSIYSATDIITMKNTMKNTMLLNNLRQGQSEHNTHLMVVPLMALTQAHGNACNITKPLHRKKIYYTLYLIICYIPLYIMFYYM